MAKTDTSKDGNVLWKDRMTKELLKGESRQKVAQPNLPKSFDRNGLTNCISSTMKCPAKNFLLPWLDIVQVLEAEKLSETMCRATFKFPVQPEFLNPMGTLHAGATSAFFECATTWTLFPIAQPGFWKTLGICRTISFTYLRPAVVGEMLVMECETVHVGKRICMLRAVMKREKDGAALVTCEHNKYNVDADMKL